jgi:hypothetical protein
MSNAKPFDLAIFVKKFGEDIMGFVLDLARTSDMGERQLIQFEKSVKSYVRRSIESHVTVLSNYTNFTVDKLVLLQKPDKDKDKEEPLNKKIGG